MLDAFATALAFGRWAVLEADHPGGMHSCRLVECFVVRHEIVVRILWRGPDEGLYTLGLHMHNSIQSFVLQRAGPLSRLFCARNSGLSGPVQAFR